MGPILYQAVPKLKTTMFAAVTYLLLRCTCYLFKVIILFDIIIMFYVVICYQSLCFYQIFYNVLFLFINSKMFLWNCQLSILSWNKRQNGRNNCLKHKNLSVKIKITGRDSRFCIKNKLQSQIKRNMFSIY